MRLIVVFYVVPISRRSIRFTSIAHVLTYIQEIITMPLESFLCFPLPQRRRFQVSEVQRSANTTATTNQHPPQISFAQS